MGRALVKALGARVRTHCCITITLDTDDEGAQTSLAGVDRYPDRGHTSRRAATYTAIPMSSTKSWGTSSWA